MLNLFFKFKYYFLGVVFLIFFYFFYQLFIPVNNFPVDTIFKVNRGESIQEIFVNLKEEKFIRSEFWAKVYLRIFKFEKFYPGEYEFPKPVSLYEILYAVTKRPNSYAVLIPEGFTKKQVSERLAKYIKNFDSINFLKNAEEGYLFPETYYFYSFSNNEEILKEFQDHFYEATFKHFGRIPTKDEVIIASMLEREARNKDDMKIIAGIYYNRLKINMPLQVDATVLYGQGAWKQRVYYKDLKHDSDYNTYKNTGLPIGPISNPGLNALEAAIYPKKTSYFYYLSDNEGKMYFAKTFDEHVKNKLKYLK